MKIVKCEKCNNIHFFRLEIGVKSLDEGYGIYATLCCECGEKEMKFGRIPVLSKEQFPKQNVENVDDFLEVTLEVLKSHLKK